MALSNPPAFIGKITVTDYNNKIYWTEASTGALSATVPDGDYFPDALCAAMKTVMDAASSSNSYALTFAQLTGKYTITATGSETFAVDPRTSKTANIWIGGNTDSAGNTWGTGQYSPYNLGFAVDTGTTGTDTAHTSPQTAGSVWLPNMPPFEDSLQEFDSSNTVESISLDGTSKVYDFTGWSTSYDSKDFPLYGGLRQKRALDFRLINQAARDQYVANFWGPYAKGGGAFLYYPDNAGSTYYQYRLHSESLRTNTFVARLAGYPLYTGSILMVRA